MVYIVASFFIFKNVLHYYIIFLLKALKKTLPLCGFAPLLLRV